MGIEEFKLRGLVVRMCRLMKKAKLKDMEGITGINLNTLALIEREERSISKLNEIRLTRGLMELGITNVQLEAIQLIVEHDEGKFEE
jgi:hypothetical protein